MILGEAEERKKFPPLSYEGGGTHHPLKYAKSVNLVFFSRHFSIKNRCSRANKFPAGSGRPIETESYSHYHTRRDASTKQYTMDWDYQHPIYPQWEHNLLHLEVSMAVLQKLHRPTYLRLERDPRTPRWRLHSPP